MEGEDKKINENGLSLQVVSSGFMSGYKALALNGKIIPGQTGLIIGKKNKWNTRIVQVFFEVYDEGTDDLEVI